LRQSRAQPLEHRRLGRLIEHARRLIEQQHRTALGRKQAARERKALSLPARQVHAALG